MINIKSDSDLEKMKVATGIVRDFLYEVESRVKPGVCTFDIDKFAREFIEKFGAKPSFLNYNGFPASICLSIDCEVVHGMPSKKRYIEEGQIVSIDVGAYIKGYHGDAARSFLVGNCSDEKKQLVEVTRQSFFKGIEKAVVGNRLGDLSHAIQAHAESFGYGVVRELCGHGIGTKLHEDPEVLNYGTAGRGIRFQKGMVIAVEPMINMGSEKVEFLKDGWTCVTRDRKPSAHYENTIAITGDGEPLILTL